MGREICPFAKKPFEESRFHLSLCSEAKIEAQKDFFRHELSKISKSESISNSFLIFEHGNSEYLDFLDFYEDCLVDLGEEFQLVSFHPHFYFAETPITARVNWVNRSPYPSLHLLRVSEVSAVISDPQMGVRISESNEKKLEAMSKEEFQALTSKWQI